MLLMGFTRAEVQELARVSSNRLVYFERYQIAIPQKFGSSKKSTCIYTWPQLVMLTTLAGVQHQLGSAYFKRLKDAIEQVDLSSDQINQLLWVIEDRVFWGSFDDATTAIREVRQQTNNKQVRVFIMCSPLAEIIELIKFRAKRAAHIDYEGFIERVNNYKPSTADCISSSVTSI